MASHCLRLIVVSLWLLQIGQSAFEPENTSGHSECPCMEWAGLEDYLVMNGSRLAVYPAGSAGTRYLNPENYGNLECRAWDAALPPYCMNADGSAKNTTPIWCSSMWCWVDAANCKYPLIYRSSYFSEPVYYSYSTCGARNTYKEWFVHETSNETRVHDLSDLIRVVEAYAMATRDAIETAYEQHLGSGTNCFLASGCECGECVPDTHWGQKVSFTDTMALTKSETFRCLGMIISETYKRIVGQEYDDPTRVGYLYFASQEDGSYLQWPGMSWCPPSWDPRFRDWYAGTAAGPKDVVIVIDTSGSMRKASRMDLAKEAATKVLDTLTWVDFVTVVAFDDDVITASESLVPATGDNRRKLKEWISKVEASGGTNFIDSLNTALNLLHRHRSNECLTTGCYGALLFLTDGDPDEWGESNYQNLKYRNSDGYVRIFGYVLGLDAKRDVTDRLASDHGGQFVVVPDGGNLNDAMASYYQHFMEDTDYTAARDKVRWILYKDAITGIDLFAGCMPVYDRGEERFELLGVTCMDINLIVDLPTLRTTPGWTEFEQEMETNSRQCLGSSKAGLVLSSRCVDTWNEYAVSSGFRFYVPVSWGIVVWLATRFCNHHP